MYHIKIVGENYVLVMISHLIFYKDILIYDKYMLNSKMRGIQKHLLWKYSSKLKFTGASCIKHTTKNTCPF
jgi:hypothetical protein